MKRLSRVHAMAVVLEIRLACPDRLPDIKVGIMILLKVLGGADFLLA